MDTEIRTELTKIKDCATRAGSALNDLATEISEFCDRQEARRIDELDRGLSGLYHTLFSCYDSAVPDVAVSTLSDDDPEEQEPTFSLHEYVMRRLKEGSKAESIANDIARYGLIRFLGVPLSELPDATLPCGRKLRHFCVRGDLERTEGAPHVFDYDAYLFDMLDHNKCGSLSDVSSPWAVKSAGSAILDNGLIQGTCYLSDPAWEVDAVAL